MITALHPLEEATRLQCMDNATLGQLLPLLKFVDMVLKEMASQNKAEATAQLATILLAALYNSKLLNSIKEDVAASFFRSMV